MEAMFTKQLFPEHLSTQYTGCSMWYSFHHCTPEGRRKHQSDDTSGDCKWNVRSCYWKPRIVYHFTHTQESPEQSITFSLSEKLHGQAHFNGFVNSSILRSAQVPKWNNTSKCRECKHNLTTHFALHMLKLVPQNLTHDTYCGHWVARGWPSMTFMLGWVV